MYRVIFDWSSLKQAMFQAYKYNLRKKVMDLNKFREVQYKNHPVDCTRPNYTKIQGVFLLVLPSVKILYENTKLFTP